MSNNDKKDVDASKDDNTRHAEDIARGYASTSTGPAELLQSAVEGGTREIATPAERSKSGDQSVLRDARAPSSPFPR